MTNKEVFKFINSIDSINAEYIMQDSEIMKEFEWAERYLNQGKKDMYLFCLRRVREKIGKFGEYRLTPANAKVGEGATVNLWSDRHAATIIKVTKCTITVRQDKAILNPDFKPEWIPGGFAAHCTNQSEQSYTYEADETGNTYTFRWSKKYCRYGTPGNLSLSKGRHEFYDYNF